MTAGQPTPNMKWATSLVELPVVIATMTILIEILLPVVQKISQRAQPALVGNTSPYGGKSLGSPHLRRFHVAVADGSLRTVSDWDSPATIKTFGDVAYGIPFNPDDR